MNSEIFQSICQIANTNGMNSPKVDGELRRMVYSGTVEIKFVQEHNVELRYFLAEFNGNLPKFKAWVICALVDLYIEDWKVRHKGARCPTPQRANILRSREQFTKDLIFSVEADYNRRRFITNVQFKPALDQYFFQDIDPRDLEN